MAWSIDSALKATLPDTASSFLGYVLSTITSPSFFQVVVVYRWQDFRAVEILPHPGRPLLRQVSQVDSAEDALRHRRRFGVLREAHKTRDFQLVLNAAVWDPVVEYSVQMLEQAVTEEKAKGGFGDFLSEPLVACHPQRSRTIDHGEVE